MNKEKGLFINALGARFTAILRKAHNDLDMSYEDINSTLDFIGCRELEGELGEAIQAALDRGFTGDDIGLVFGHCVNELITNDSEGATDGPH